MIGPQKHIHSSRRQWRRRRFARLCLRPVIVALKPKLSLRRVMGYVSG